MPALLIHNAGGAWEALIANTNQALAFAGATEVEQAASVQLLAEGMAGGEGALADVILNVFEGAPEWLEGGTLVADLFGTTDALIFGETVIFEAAEAGGSLLATLAEAGEALLAVLA